METIKGYVEHIIYRNTENGYTVLNFVADTEEEITMVGIFETIDQGETLEAEGEKIQHPTYGEQFKMSSYVVKTSENEAGIRLYLASGAIKGIGETLAERIIARFGADTLRIMEDEPERLAEVKGISERKAREIGVLMDEKKDLKDAMIFLKGYGLSNVMAMKIYDTYGERLYHVMRDNPYKLAEDIHGIGFKVADEIAMKAGLLPDSEYRIRCGLLYLLSAAGGEGHTYLPMEELLIRGEALLEVAGSQLEIGLKNLAMDRQVIIKMDEVYHSSAYYAELQSAKLLTALAGSFAPDGADREKAEEGVLKKVARIEQESEICLDDLQKEAVVASALNGVLILTGGPGTGKTTTINTILRYFHAEGLSFCLAAPTGRAAKRMTEATGYEAKTIHRLLELNGAMTENQSASYFERNEDNPLDVDLIVIDEMSMVDIYLFLALLKAISIGTRLILVGDMNQLPSVGPGKVLKDLIESGSFCVVKLEKIFRQAMESHIVTNAHKIHNGEQLVLDNKSKDFFFLRRNDVNVIYKHMIQLITEKLPGYVNAGSQDIQVLTPMRKGALGVETLNKILQQYLNPPDPSKREHLFGETLFREGDKVMQIKNNYKLEWEILSKYHIPIDRGL
ncbi:MAG: ATP-dependent RecD-like DNA helicase, partial [Lachnospiraceae bacterium]|nr:ATP-dependent RecD-like DNA helicase [Lachnospiraceae bacterium]